MDFDVVIVGSGFGGSVMACRLAEAGLRVCVLERGRRYGFGEFPRRLQHFKDDMFWDPEDDRHGLMEIRAYASSDVATVSASGLGGGSLIYANVLYRADADFFAGWPGGITRTELEPYYDRAEAMLEGARYPIEEPVYRDNPKAHLMARAAAVLQQTSESAAKPAFLYPPLAVRFAGDFPGHQSRNQQGVLQSSCTMCGECDIGCNIHAKNTLDLNYLARAEGAARHGGHAAEIRTEAWVQSVRAVVGGYEIQYRHPKSGATNTVTAAQVVVAAGSVGTTGLLLKMRAAGALPNLSPQLGSSWCGNGDLEGTVILPGGVAAQPEQGPVIATTLDYRFGDYPDGFAHGLLIQEGGVPGFLAWYLAGKLPSTGPVLHALKLMGRVFWHGLQRLLGRRHSAEVNIGDDVAKLLDDPGLVGRVLILLGMGRDRSDGRIELNARGEPVIKWRIDASRLHYDRVRQEMRRVSDALGGTYIDSPLTYLDKVIAVHPLGGCVMGTSADDGVIDENCEAFGHPGLYVVDGSAMPTSVGANPSLTIAALAERTAERFIRRHRTGTS